MLEIENNCPCDNPQIVKKGFSGSNSVLCFLAIFIVSAVIIGITLNEQDKNTQSIAQGSDLEHLAGTMLSHFYENSILISAATVACFLGLFAGTIGMNKLYSICPKCGKKIYLK